MVEIRANSKEELLKQLKDLPDTFEEDRQFDECDVYHFPAVKTDGCSVAQLSKIFEEMGELACAINCGGTVYDVLTEAWDVIHATETLMRIVSDVDDVAAAHETVLIKNAMRGYYEDCE
jgi:hypothetical protein